jgi:hypothetical protein
VLVRVYTPVHWIKYILGSRINNVIEIVDIYGNVTDFNGEVQVHCNLYTWHHCTRDCSTFGYLTPWHSGVCSVFPVFGYVVVHFVCIICRLCSLQLLVHRYSFAYPPPHPTLFTWQWPCLLAVLLINSTNLIFLTGRYWPVLTYTCLF